MLSEKIKSIFFMVALFYTLMLSGCASLNDVVKEKESGAGGLAKTYPVTSDQAWKIAMAVFRWEGADAIEEHKDEGYMLTSSGINAYSYGTVMGAWVKPLGNSNTEVTVVTKRRLATNVFTTLTEGTFHNRFAQGVSLVKAGKPLPSIAPD